MDEQSRINKEFRETLNDHAKHLQIANSEMGIIKNDIAWIKSEFYNFVQIINKLDGRTWMILTTTILGVLGLIVQIILAIYKK